MITGRTQIASVIGDPITHSLSPVMHNAAFAALGIDAAYIAFHVLPADLPRAVAGIRALGLLGCNVTVPHKEKILRLLDSVSPTAQRTGAVNTVIRRGTLLHGENTDVVGLRRALDEAGVRLAGANVVLIGAGGAARAAVAALGDAGASRITIANRTLSRARRLVRDFASPGVALHAVGLDALEDPALLAGCDVVLNSSSLGLGGEPFTGVAFTASPRHCIFYEMIPRPDTPFLAGAAAAKRRRFDGLGMLLHQGAAAFELWTGQAPPVGTMRRALLRAQRRRDQAR